MSLYDRPWKYPGHKHGAKEDTDDEPEKPLLRAVVLDFSEV